MQYTVNRQPKGKIDIKVDVPQATFEESYKNTLTEVGKDANISGFRPGMAPADVVEKHVGISKVLNESASFLINKHLAEIFEKEMLFPIDSPKISIATLAFGSPFSYTVSFTQKPQVKVGDWRKIKIKKVAAKEITETDVAESIKNIFEAWKKQKEAKGAEGTDGAEDKEELGKYIYNAQGEKIFIKDEESKSKIEGEQKIDDNFAKAIGARDLEHLKEIVRKDLENIVTDQVEAKLEQEVFEEVAKISDVEVPEILVEDELNRILVRLTNQLEQQGRDLDTYLKEQKTTIDDLKANWKEQAEKNVKTTLIMDEIGRAEKIQVTKEEIDAAMKGVTQTNISAEQRQDLERYIALSIFQAKTLDLVKKAIAAS